MHKFVYNIPKPKIDPNPEAQPNVENQILDGIQARFIVHVDKIGEDIINGTYTEIKPKGLLSID